MKALFQVISVLGTPFFYLPIVTYFAVVNQKLAISLLLILIPTEIICGAIKYIYPKKRPVPMPDKTLIQKYLAGSFPSVHTARTTAFSVVMANLYTNPILILIALIVIAGVGYSRIHLKKHYFVDVLAGFLIGALISFLGLNIQNYLNLY